MPYKDLFLFQYDENMFKAINFYFYLLKTVEEVVVK